MFNVGDGSYIVVKLSSGDEIVAQVNSSDEGSLYVKQPLQVTIMRGPDGQPGKALMPYLMLAPESNAQINKSCIVAFTMAPKEVEQAYIQETSGIVIAR